MNIYENRYRKWFNFTLQKYRRFLSCADNLKKMLAMCQKTLHLVYVASV